jgi:RNA recognition motif-containing protein
VHVQEFRGFGFVSFRSAFAAEDAAEDANGKEVLGGRVKVNIAKYKSTTRPPVHRDERCADL